MKLISLFSGIGGFELAAEWMGWENIVSCEINTFGRQVLAHYWPNSYHHTDIHTLTIDVINEELTQRFGPSWRNDDIILTGGFPCQPFSSAGARKGTDDPRHLWPEMLRVIREVQPTWVVGENVFGLINLSGGLVFEQVQADLEAQGYEVQAYVLPAVSVNAPHRRDRVWIVAHCKVGDRGGYGKSRASENSISNGCLCGQVDEEGAEDGQQRHTCTGDCNRICGEEMAGIATDSEGKRSERLQPCEQCEISEQEQEQFRGGDCQNIITNTRLLGQTKRKQQTARIIERGCWEQFPTQSPVRKRDDGLPARLDGITFPKWRNESIKAAGNAIVPQVALQIFKAIQAYTELSRPC